MAELFGRVNAFLVLAMIAGIVEAAKKIGVKGNACLALSMGLGMVFGVALQLAEMYPAISPWVQVAVYGVLLGLAASGLYDLVKRAGNALLK